MLIFFFLLEAEKKKKKNRHFQLQQWSLTVAAALQQLVHSFFFLFFLPTTKTLQADTATIEIKDQNNVVWGVGMGRKKKKVMTKKKSNANSADLSLHPKPHDQFWKANILHLQTGASDQFSQMQHETNALRLPPVHPSASYTSSPKRSCFVSSLV